MENLYSNWTTLIPEDFAPESRVWIYQSSRMFGLSEALQIEEMLENFVRQWNSHGSPVKGYANLLFGQFVMLMADESATGVSGCSTDSSVRVIREIENRFNVSMFDRQMLAFLHKDKVELIPMAQFSYAVDKGIISPDTLYFNNLVPTKAALLQEWMIPVRHSWLAKRFPLLREDVC